MRLIVILCLVAATTFSVYWVYSARQMRSVTAQILDHTPQIDATPHSVTGFPTAFRMQLDNAQWQSRTGLFLWRAPYLELTTPSYRPEQILFTLAPEQTLVIGAQDFTLRSADPQGDITLGRDMQLTEAALMLETLEIAPSLLVQQFSRFEARLREVDDAQYRLEATANDIEFAAMLRAQLDPDQILPAQISRLTIDIGLGYAEPIMFGAALPALNELDLDTVTLDWGDLHLSLSGRIVRDPSGWLEGTVTLTASDWEPLHQLLVASEALAPDMAMMAGMLLSGQADPDTGEITLPLQIRQSDMYLGPLRLLQLPRL